MSTFVVPNFPNVCNLFTPVTPFTWDKTGATIRAGSVSCQLVPPHRAETLSQTPNGMNLGDASDLNYIVVQIWFPAGTDVRSYSDTISNDILELLVDGGGPSSRRWYIIIQVEDVANAYPNAYRTAYCVPMPGTWLAPYKPPLVLA